MNILPALLFLAAATASPRVAITDSVHTRLSRIIKTTIEDELRLRSVEVADAGDYVAEIVGVSDAGRKGRTTSVQKDMTHSVQVTEVVGGAAAEVWLYDKTHHLVATYKLTGSGSSSAAVGSTKGDLLTAFVVAPLFSRSRSADGARAIGHDVAASIAAAISAPATDTPQH